MTNDALKMPDEIYLLHNEGDMGEHLWCENIPNDEMEFTKYIRADRAAQGYIGGGDGWREMSTIPDNLMSGVDLWDDREEKRYINCTFDLRVQAWADENSDFVKIPTHWMPKPAAPKKERM